MELTATKASKNKKHKIAFMSGAVKVKYKIKNKEKLVELRSFI